MRVYVESTIPSYVTARPARDVVQAARQLLTKEWWDLHRVRHELFISQIVLDEIGVGDPEMVTERLNLVRSLPLLDLTQDALDLASEFLKSGALPKDAERDAAHIALATVHNLDILLTWNCRHIANAAIQPKLRSISADHGLTLPQLCSPESMLGGAADELE